MRPRYLVDAMLGNVSRKLRMLGYDAEYARDGARICEVASSDRILITKNTDLLHAAARLHLPVITGGTERDIMHRILCGTMPTISCEAARCTICNGMTISVPLHEALERAPDGIKHTDFWRCRVCGHLYWEGTHMERVREAAGSWI